MSSRAIALGNGTVRSCLRDSKSNVALIHRDANRSLEFPAAALLPVGHGTNAGNGWATETGVVNSTGIIHRGIDEAKTACLAAAVQNGVGLACLAMGPLL